MRSPVITALAAIVAFAVVGCSDSGSGGDGGTGDGGGDAVAWADSVCTSIKDDVEAIGTRPEIDQSNPQAAKDSLVAYLGTLETSLDGVASAFADAGDPPVADGAEAVQGFVDQVDSAKEATTSAKTKIEGASVSDTAGFQTAVASALEDLQKVAEIDTTESFSSNDALKQAYDQAAACKELEKTGS